MALLPRGPCERGAANDTDISVSNHQPPEALAITTIVQPAGASAKPKPTQIAGSPWRLANALHPIPRLDPTLGEPSFAHLERIEASSLGPVCCFSLRRHVIDIENAPFGVQERDRQGYE